MIEFITYSVFIHTLYNSYGDSLLTFYGFWCICNCWCFNLITVIISSLFYNVCTIIRWNPCNKWFCRITKYLRATQFRCLDPKNRIRMTTDNCALRQTVLFSYRIRTFFFFPTTKIHKEWKNTSNIDWYWLNESYVGEIAEGNGQKRV